MTTKEEMEELDALEEFEKEYLERAEGQQRRIDLTKGVALGLFYGIIGNLFVQFFYPVVEGIILKEYDMLFWSNVVISAIALVGIILATLSFRNQLSWSRLVMEGERRGARVVRRMIEEEKAKLRNKSESRKTERARFELLHFPILLTLPKSSPLLKIVTETSSKKISGALRASLLLNSDFNRFYSTTILPSKHLDT